MKSYNGLSAADVLQAEHDLLAEQKKWLNSTDGDDGQRVTYIMGIIDFASQLLDRIENGITFDVINGEAITVEYVKNE